MNTELILKNVARHINLTKKEEAVFLELLKEKKIKKRQFFLHENDVATQIAFVNKGCLRCYSIDNNGFEHIVQFATCEWWISDLGSLISQKKSTLNIDAIIDTEILILSRENQFKLLEEIPKFERFFRILTENSLVSAINRLNANLSLNAQQRYNNFCKTYPSLVNLIPQKYIASFIGVTPEFLSKMKAEFLKKK